MMRKMTNKNIKNENISAGSFIESRASSVLS